VFLYVSFTTGRGISRISAALCFARTFRLSQSGTINVTFTFHGAPSSPSKRAPMAQHILIVDDDPVQRRLLEAAITRAGLPVVTAPGGQPALDLVNGPRGDQIALMLLDLVMPDMDGIAVLGKLRCTHPELPVIVLTAKGGIESAVEAMRAGANDFLVKPASPERITVSIRNAMKIGTLSGEVTRLKKKTENRLVFDDRIHIFWNKVGILLKEMEHADYTLWLDADALVVGNNKLEDVLTPFSLSISTDFNGICCGVFIIKNCKWSFDLLSAWQFLNEVDEGEVERYESKNLHDQTGLKCLLKNFPSVKKQVGAISQELVLNPKAPYVEKPFIMHYWTGSGDPMCITEKITRFIRQGWSTECF
jgi:DNA-binding response OmpR family regulator